MASGAGSRIRGLGFRAIGRDGRSALRSLRLRSIPEIIDHI
tara:strand:+ start:596 stop:718 length:123 start_codon:yes stop_codon:yes gene_type:complete